MKVDRYEAKRLLGSMFNEPETEIINVKDALHRVLAQDICAPRDFPDTRRSAVDGYAHIIGAEKYTVTGETGAGRKGPASVSAEEAVFVMTGGNVPEHADAVARVEDCEVSGAEVKIPPQKKGNNINGIAEENHKGDLLAAKGSFVDNGLYPVLFCQGFGTVSVYKRPKIGIFVTGDEILEAGDEYVKGFVYNTNRYILDPFFVRCGFDYEYFGHVRDSRDKVKEAFEQMSEKYDVIISSGGISMGKYDYVKEVFKTCGYEILFQKTAIKPGSPLMAARRDGCAFIGMPGYPAAFMTNLVFYVLPALKKACGFKDYENSPVNVVMGSATSSKEGRFDINRACVKSVDGVLTAFDPGTQMTSHFNSFAGVNAFLLLDENTGRLSAGDTAKAILI